MKYIKEDRELKSVKRYAVVIILLMSSLILSSAIPVNYTGSNNLSNIIDNSLNQIQPPSNVIDNNSTDNSTAGPAADSDYGKLRDGSAYYYTDVNKITEYRNGTIDSDVSFNTVSASAEHGSANNPYVISTVAQWNAFAADTANATNANKIFVLGADLDFEGKTFAPVNQFNATFYGQNFALKNISYQGNGSTSCGVFSNTGSTVKIADLGVSNFNITNGGVLNGLICGYSDGGYYLNCHTQGSITAGGTTALTSSGGLVGKMGGASTITFYRCSSSNSQDITNVRNSNGEGGGGILGLSYGNNAKSIFYDCYARSYLRYGGSGDYWPGGIAGFSETGAGDVTIENCFAYTTQTDAQLIAGPTGPNNPDFRGACSSGFLGISGISSRAKISIKNVYGYGSVEQNGAYITMPPVMAYTNNNGAMHIPTGNLTFDNINWYEDCSKPVSYHYTVDFIKTKFPGNSYKEYDSTLSYNGKTAAEAFWAKAKDDSNLSDNIWTNKSIISKEYVEDVDKDQYTIYNSPVRNPLIIRVSYYDLNVNNGVEKETLLFSDRGEDGDGWIKVDAGDPLIDLTTESSYTIKPNHIFKGWTPDKTGATEPIKTVTGLLGDVKLYACWDIAPSAIDVKAFAKDGIDSAVYAEGEVTLQGTIGVTGVSASNLAASYKWHKKGSSSTVSTTAGYRIQNVNDSGTYLYEYTIYDRTEPLWRHSGSSPEVAGTLSKGSLEVKAFSLDKDTPAYVGKELGQLKFTVIMQNVKGESVAGTADWQFPIATLDNSGSNTHNITFTPTSQADKDNYDNSVKYPVQFDVDNIVLTFDLSQIDRTIVVPLVYNNNYNYTWIIDEFNKRFAENSKTDEAYKLVANRTPFLGEPDADESAFKEINDFNTSYEKVQASFVIKVDFRKTEFTVTFVKDNGEPDVKEKYFYNNYIIKPDDPKKTDINGDELAFIGWYFDTVDENNKPVSRAWSFNEDTVTKNLTLTARYLSADMTLVELLVKPNKTLTATNRIQKGDLTITAKLHGEAEGIPIDQDVDLAFDANGLVYEYPNNIALSVANPTVTVKYTFKGVTKEVTVTLTVEPKEIKLGEEVKFESASFPKDGKPHKLTEIDEVLLPVEVASVNYIYRDSNGIVIDDLNTITEVGVYQVQAVFNMTSSDYMIKPLSATLTITRAATVVKVEWDNNTFVFNGLVQHPTAKIVREDGSEVNVEFEYTGDIEALEYGSYLIGVKLKSTLYQLEDSKSYAFTIEKAVFTLPTQSKPATYNGEPIFLKDLLDIFDENLMIIEGDASGINATSYSALLRLKFPESSEWQGNPSSTVTVNWKIDRAHLSAIWNGTEFIYKAGETYSPQLRGLSGLAAKDKDLVNYINDFTYTGDVEVSESGAYLISVALNYVSDWANNYILDGNIDLYYAVVPRPGMTVISIEWSVPEGGLIFDGSVKKPTYVILDSDGNEVTGVKLVIGGDYDSAIWAGDYSLTASIDGNSNYFIRKGSKFDYSILKNDKGEGENPNKDGNGNLDGGNDILAQIQEFFKKLIESNFPLWQVATSGVALLLTLIFMIKAIQYGNRKKKAKGEIKRYNAKTYAALLPIFSTQTVWLNLSNMVWSIIAFSLCGFMLLMFLIMVINRKGWKKAEVAKQTAIDESEQRRFEAERQERREFQERVGQGGDSSALIADLRRELQSITQSNKEGGSAMDSNSFEQRLLEMEERHRQEMARRDEEQAKRDEAMKIMLANMMGRQQADGGMGFAAMDDTDLLVQKVIAGLLPAVQQMLPEAPAYLAAPSEQNDELIALVEQQNEEMRNMAAQMSDLQEQLAYMSQERCDAVLLPETAVAADQSEEIKNLNAKMELMQQKMDMMSAMSVDDLDDDDLDDDEEEWDSILDEDDDDFVEAVIIEEDGTVKKTYPNFRMRLKQSSDKNREWYAAVKNLFCSQKGVTYRVYKRVEKIRYQGQVIAVIGIAKRSIKLWLALKPYEYDARRYHHKDVSDKPRFVDVPMYVRVSSDRALTRAQELILALFQELNMEARKRYNDRSIQELIFTLKHNKLLTNKQNKGLLCEVMHVHDCDVLSDELAEKCIESKNVESIDESYIETLKLDDIDAKFQDGNRVTLEKLKKVGLVSEDCTGYTVTAGQRLTKPLIIVANDFTLPAVKMITLTGGRAIKLNQLR